MDDSAKTSLTVLLLSGMLFLGSVAALQLTASNALAPAKTGPDPLETGHYTEAHALFTRLVRAGGQGWIPGTTSSGSTILGVSAPNTVTDTGCKAPGLCKPDNGKKNGCAIATQKTDPPGCLKQMVQAVQTILFGSSTGTIINQGNTTGGRWNETAYVPGLSKSAGILEKARLANLGPRDSMTINATDGIFTYGEAKAKFGIPPTKGFHLLVSQGGAPLVDFGAAIPAGLASRPDDAYFCLDSCDLAHGGQMVFVRLFSW